MEDVIMQITGPNVVLITIDTQSSYLEARKSIEEKIVKKSDDIEPKAAIELKLKQNTYNDYCVNTREVFIDRMLENAEERERIVRFARNLVLNLVLPGDGGNAIRKQIKCPTNFQKKKKKLAVKAPSQLNTRHAFEIYSTKILSFILKIYW
jgi:hypothetical protein